MITNVHQLIDFLFFPCEKIPRRNAASVCKIKKDEQGRNGEQPSTVPHTTQECLVTFACEF